VNTRRPGNYQGLGGPSQAGQGHDYLEIRPDSYQEPATTLYEELDANTRRPGTYQGLGEPPEEAQDHEYFEVHDYMTPI